MSHLFWAEKLAENAPVGDGHWRTLKMDSVGTGPGGEPVQGKTWVNKLKPSVKLKPHQQDFTNAVLRLPERGGIIAAHGTGTGKTNASIAAFENLRGVGKAQKALVVTPSGLRTNFVESGVQRFTDSKAQIINSPSEYRPDTDYAVVSYDAFRKRPTEFVKAINPDVLIADEVHRAANPQSKNYQALLQARQEIPKFLGLTASVVQNSPEEVLSLLRIADPTNPQIPTATSFRRKFIESSESTNRGIFGGRQRTELIKNKPQLMRDIGSAIHYVEDLDASEKPAKEITMVPVEMSPEQVNLYRLSMKGVDPVILDKIKRGEAVSDKKTLNIFTRLLRARQVSNSLGSVKKMPPAQAAEKTPKMKRILDDTLEHIQKTPDGQVVLYTNLVHGGVDVLEAGLKKRGIPFGIFAGRGVPGVTEESRQQAVRDYLAGKNKAIIITGAGAEGLSLGNTTLVQDVDGHYNPERINQAEARGVRAGGLSHRPVDQRRVEVRRYVSALPKNILQKLHLSNPEKSVEEWVYAVADRKTNLNKQLREVLKERSDHERRKRDSRLYAAYSKLVGKP